MIIIADSGSTSTSWRFIDSKGTVEQKETVGLNPYYSSRQQLKTEIINGLSTQYSTTSSELYFYGSGCESLEMKSLMSTILKEVFPMANVEVQGDMLGAARASAGTNEGIIGILGTGSNSCYYDGSNIVSNVDSLGFIMGDEGSGNYMGRKLLAGFLRKSMPEDLAEKLERRYTLSRDEILRKVYKEDAPSRYLAQFGKFIFQNRKNPYMSELIIQSIESFFKEHICRYENYETLPCHFVGSIAFYFSDYVRKVGKGHNIHVKNVLENPIAGLTLYHTGLS